MREFVGLLAAVACMSTQAQESVQVGKHVTANTDAGSMILSLLLVLVLIIISALVLKKFQSVKQSDIGLKIVSSLHLGAKERIIVVQAGTKQLVLGVTAQQINVLDTLDEPLAIDNEASLQVKQPLPSVLQTFFNNKQIVKTDDK